MTARRHGKAMTCLIAVAALVVGFSIAGAAGGEVAAPAPSDPLVALNDAAHAAYLRAKQEALARIGPVIFVAGDNLVLRQGARRTEVRFIPDVYHTLKAVSHIPLALDVMLTPTVDGGRVDDDLLDDLQHYRRLIVAAREHLASLGLTPEQTRRQGEIVAGSLAFIDRLTASRTCPPGSRAGFTHRMSPLVMANANDAAQAALDALDRLVRHWKDQMALAEWDRVTVVVMGQPLPRKDNLAVQYFARLLGVAGEGRRIVYAESLHDEPRALDLLATRLVDTQVGLDFFDDPGRMHRDLLSDAARQYLDVRFGRPGHAAGRGQ